jgi:quercetin dioxygenase-like cupin family protein
MSVNTTETREVNFLGVRARILAEGLVEMRDVPAGDMPPLHVHHTHDECFYMLDGEVTLYLPGENSVTLRAGDFFLAPRGVPHTYRVSDAGPAAWLCLSTPAGFDRFVADVGALEEQDPASVAAIGAKYDIEILAPPGTLP